MTTTRQRRRVSHPLAMRGHALDEAIQPDIGDYHRTQLKLPALPPAVSRRDSKLAMDDAGSGFGFLNQTTFGQAAFGLYFPGYPWLAELAQRSEYRQPVETVAKELTRKWITFKSKGEGDKSERIAQIEDDFESFKIQRLFREAAGHDGYYGMGMLFVDINKHPKEDPLIIAPQTIGVGSLNGFTTVEPMWLSPLMYNATDATRPDFYVPNAWMVMGMRVDSTRLLRFISREVPDIIKPAYNFGGISLTQLIEPYVSRWLKTVGAVNRLISNFSIIVLQTDMASLLAKAPGGADLMARLKRFNQMRDNQGVFLTDKERELLEQVAVPLSGLSELQAQAQEHMAAPTHLPLVVLTGITPSGLNASSDSELEVYHDWVHGQQEALFSDPLDKILQIIQLNRFGDIDPDITYDYVPLKELVGEAAARITKMAADAGIAYIDAGVIDPAEERERIANDPNSGYNNLDVNKTIEPPLDPVPEPPGGDGDE